MDWIEQADLFWAGELGVAPGALRSGGFLVHDRVDTDAQPRATIVGTSTSTIVSLPEGRAQTFERAGLRLEHLARSPRAYVAGCAAIERLYVAGPAYLGYWPSSSARATLRGRTEPVGADALVSLASLGETAPADWEEAGIGPHSRVFGCRVEGRLVAVAGYERWPGAIAQLQVFCHPAYRRRGLAGDALGAAIDAALRNNLLPQYRARDGNAASVALARQFGFVEYGWMATLRVRSPERPPAVG